MSDKFSRRAALASPLLAAIPSAEPKAVARVGDMAVVSIGPAGGGGIIGQQPKRPFVYPILELPALGTAGSYRIANGQWVRIDV